MRKARVDHRHPDYPYSDHVQVFDRPSVDAEIVYRWFNGEECEVLEGPSFWNNPGLMAHGIRLCKVRRGKEVGYVNIKWLIGIA